MNAIDINSDLLDDPNMMGKNKSIKINKKIKKSISYFNSNDIDMINAFDLEDEIKSNIASLVKNSNINQKTFNQSIYNQKKLNTANSIISLPNKNVIQTNNNLSTNVRGGSSKVEMENAGRNQSEKVEIKDKDISTSTEKTKEKIISGEKASNPELKEKNNEIKDENNNNEDKNKKILGMKPVLFYSILTILVIGIGFYTFKK
jgi:hypothetical protein